MVLQHYTLAHPNSTLNAHLTQRYRSLVLAPHQKEGFNTLFKTLKQSLRPRFPEGRLISYGSYPAGVALRDSDLDLTFLLDTKDEGIDELQTCHDIKKILRGIKTHTGVSRIKNPRVARVKGRQSALGTFQGYRIKFSLSVNNFDGPLVSSIFSSAAKHKLARNLIMLVKDFAQVHEIDSSHNGCPSSAAYCYLTIVVLQLAKVLQRFRKADLAPLRNLLHDTMNTDCLNINLEVLEPPPSLPILADLLYRVFRFFISEVDLTVYALSVTRSHLKKKADLGWPHFDNDSGKVIQKNLVCIENPFAHENLAKNVHSGGLKKIREVFEKAYDMLRRGEPPDLLFQRFITT